MRSCVCVYACVCAHRYLSWSVCSLGTSFSETWRVRVTAWEERGDDGSVTSSSKAGARKLLRLAICSSSTCSSTCKHRATRLDPPMHTAKNVLSMCNHSHVACLYNPVSMLPSFHPSGPMEPLNVTVHVPNHCPHLSCLKNIADAHLVKCCHIRPYIRCLSLPISAYSSEQKAMDGRHTTLSLPTHAACAHPDMTQPGSAAHH